MMWTWIFWGSFILIAFALALAVQVRLLAGIALRRAAQARFSGLTETEARSLVAEAANNVFTSEHSHPGSGSELAHMVETYPRPLGHIRTARLVCKLAPAALLLLVLARRILNGGI